jgi:hypothetical protein
MLNYQGIAKNQAQLWIEQFVNSQRARDRSYEKQKIVPSCQYISMDIRLQRCHWKWNSASRKNAIRSWKFQAYVLRADVPETRRQLLVTSHMDTCYVVILTEWDLHDPSLRIEQFYHTQTVWRFCVHIVNERNVSARDRSCPKWQ